jgi:hypothetical protein
MANIELKDLQDLKQVIAGDIEKAAKAEAAGLKGEFDSIVKGLEEKISKGLDGYVSKADFDKAESELKKAVTALNDKNAKDVSFDAVLSDSIMKSMDTLKSYQAGNSNSATIDISKTPGIMTAAASLGGTTAAANFGINNNNQIVPIARRMRHIREIIGMGATDEAVYPFLRETPREGVFGVQNPEGSAKPQVEYKAELVYATESTIAAFQKIGRQTLSNVRGLATWIQTSMVNDLLIKEDDELLNGTGLNGRVLGFLTGASAPSSFGLTVAAPQRYDVIGGSAAKLAALNYNANFALVNPVDYWAMVLTKNDDKDYLQNVVFDASASLLYVFGIPVFATTAITAGNFVVGDSSYVMPMQREGISLRFFDQDEDNVQKNLVTARIEERILQVVRRSDAFVAGSIANAITALTPST